MAANKAACSRKYTAYHHSGLRTQPVKWIVLHDTEGGTAESNARYFSEPGSGGSAHLVIDNNKCFRTLPNNVVPWGAPGANEQGFHIEQVGYASWTAAQWLNNKGTLDTAAYKTALHLKVFGLPPKFRTAFWLRLGFRGVTTHAEVTKAFKGGSHTDPGSGWPRKYFMTQVKRFYAELP